MNYHTLSDFRVDHGAVLDRLLTEQVAELMSVRAVTLQRVAQDGMRGRASVGLSSFRRKPTLEECLVEAQEQAAKEKRGGDSLKNPARGSTTDPDARKMKMPEGGTRPAFNPSAADLQRAVRHGHRQPSHRRRGRHQPGDRSRLDDAHDRTDLSGACFDGRMRECAGTPARPSIFARPMMSPSATRYYAQEYPLLGATGNGLRVTAGRSISPGCSQTVGQRDRQPFILSPNRRWSRLRASSYLRGCDTNEKSPVSVLRRVGS